MVIIAGQVGNLFTTIRDGFKPLAPILILIASSFIAALIFMIIEGPNERFEMEKLAAEREKLLKDTAFRLNTIKSMAPIQAYNHTISNLNFYRHMLGVKDVDFNATKWNLWGAIYFTITVYTTIGYGNITPSTATGQALTIVYAFIGIPLALISLIKLGSLFAQICLYVWGMIARSAGHFNKGVERKMANAVEADGDSDAIGITDEALVGGLGRARYEMSDDDDYVKNEEVLEFPVEFLILVTLIWTFLCAGIFLLWEETWDYWLSLYFVLISFTTIGFGDITPTKYKYMIPVCLMLLTGLALVSTVLTIIQKQINALSENMEKTIDKDCQKILEELEEEEKGRSSSEREGQNGGVEGGRNLLDLSSGEVDPEKVLEIIVARMPLRRRLLYQAMSSERKKRLAKRVQKAVQNQTIGAKSVQTDPWPLEPLLPTSAAEQNHNF